MAETRTEYQVRITGGGGNNACYSLDCDSLTAAVKLRDYNALPPRSAVIYTRTVTDWEPLEAAND